MQVWKGKVWNDDLDGIVATTEGCGALLTIEARRLLGALDRGEISFEQSIDVFVKYVKGEITEEQMYQNINL